MLVFHVWVFGKPRQTAIVTSVVADGVFVSYSLPLRAIDRALEHKQSTKYRISDEKVMIISSSLALFSDRHLRAD